MLSVFGIIGSFIAFFIINAYVLVSLLLVYYIIYVFSRYIKEEELNDIPKLLAIWWLAVSSAILNIINLIFNTIQGALSIIRGNIVAIVTTLVLGTAAILVSLYSSEILYAIQYFYNCIVVLAPRPVILLFLHSVAIIYDATIPVFDYTSVLPRNIITTTFDIFYNCETGSLIPLFESVGNFSFSLVTDTSVWIATQPLQIPINYQRTGAAIGAVSGNLVRPLICMCELTEPLLNALSKPLQLPEFGYLLTSIANIPVSLTQEIYGSINTKSKYNSKPTWNQLIFISQNLTIILDESLNIFYNDFIKEINFEDFDTLEQKESLVTFPPIINGFAGNILSAALSLLNYTTEALINIEIVTNSKDYNGPSTAGSAYVDFNQVFVYLLRVPRTLEFISTFIKNWMTVDFQSILYSNALDILRHVLNAVILLVQAIINSIVYCIYEFHYKPLYTILQPFWSTQSPLFNELRFVSQSVGILISNLLADPVGCLVRSVINILLDGIQMFIESVIALLQIFIDNSLTGIQPLNVTVFEADLLVLATCVGDYFRVLSFPCNAGHNDSNVFTQPTKCPDSNFSYDPSNSNYNAYCSKSFSTASDEEARACCGPENQFDFFCCVGDGAGNATAMTSLIFELFVNITEVLATPPDQQSTAPRPSLKPLIKRLRDVFFGLSCASSNLLAFDTCSKTEFVPVLQSLLEFTLIPLQIWDDIVTINPDKSIGADLTTIFKDLISLFILDFANFLDSLGTWVICFSPDAGQIIQEFAVLLIDLYQEFADVVFELFLDVVDIIIGLVTFNENLIVQGAVDLVNLVANELGKLFASLATVITTNVIDPIIAPLNDLLGDVCNIAAYVLNFIGEKSLAESLNCNSVRRKRDAQFHNDYDNEQSSRTEKIVDSLPQIIYKEMILPQESSYYKTHNGEDVNTYSRIRMSTSDLCSTLLVYYQDKKLSEMTILEKATYLDCVKYIQLTQQVDGYFKSILTVAGSDVEYGPTLHWATFMSWHNIWNVIFDISRGLFVKFNYNMEEYYGNDTLISSEYQKYCETFNINNTYLLKHEQKYAEGTCSPSKMRDGRTIGEAYKENNIFYPGIVEGLIVMKDSFVQKYVARFFSVLPSFELILQKALDNPNRGLGQRRDDGSPSLLMKTMKIYIKAKPHLTKISQLISNWNDKYQQRKTNDVRVNLINITIDEDFEYENKNNLWKMLAKMLLFRKKANSDSTSKADRANSETNKDSAAEKLDRAGTTDNNINKGSTTDRAGAGEKSSSSKKTLVVNNHIHKDYRARQILDQEGFKRHEDKAFFERVGTMFEKRKKALKCALVEGVINDIITDFDTMKSYYETSFIKSLAYFTDFVRTISDPGSSWSQFEVQSKLLNEGLDINFTKSCNASKAINRLFKNDTNGMNRNNDWLTNVETYFLIDIENIVDTLACFITNTNSSSTDSLLFYINLLSNCNYNYLMFPTYGIGLLDSIILVYGGLIIASFVFPSLAITLLIFSPFFITPLAYGVSPFCFPALPSPLLDDLVMIIEKFILPPCINWPEGVVLNSNQNNLNGTCDPSRDNVCPPTQQFANASQFGFDDWQDNLVFLIDWKIDPNFSNNTLSGSGDKNKLLKILLSEDSLKKFDDLPDPPPSAQKFYFWLTIGHFVILSFGLTTIALSIYFIIYPIVSILYTIVTIIIVQTILLIVELLTNIRYDFAYKQDYVLFSSPHK